MKVLVLSNGQLEEKNIENTLEELQKIVGGYIEIPPLSRVFAENGIDVIINEEGKFIEGLKPEIAILDSETGRILDLVYGNCIFASHDEEGETVSLTEEQIKIVEEELDFVLGLTNKERTMSFEVRALVF
jgi:hypothetical protein